MAESSLTFTYAILRRRIGLYLGFHRNSVYWTDDEESDVTDILQEGLHKFYFPIDPRSGRAHKWNFLYPVASFTTSPSYSTGTVTIASGVVTLASGTFPTWVSTDPQDGDIVISGVNYEIDTYASTTSVTLQDTSITVAAGSSYTLTRPRYELPDDFASYDGPITYRPGTSSFYPAILVVDESMIRTWRQAYEYTYRPLRAAIIPKVMDATEGQRWQFLVTPAPDSTYYLQYRYQRIPDTLTSTNLYHHGGGPYSRAVLEACLSVAELQLNDVTADHEKAFQHAITQAIDFDKQAHSVDRLGYCGDPGDRDYVRDAEDPTFVDWTRGPVVYEG